MGKMPHFFGIRHLSPAGAYHLRAFLEEKKPKLVLVEGPSDFTDLMSDMVRKETKPPIAVLAYTKEAPIRTILYPFAEYSPEYQAILWCNKHKVDCQFMDLPSETFLAITLVNDGKERSDYGRETIYEKLDSLSGEDGQETFWERNLEHVTSMEVYHEGCNRFGSELRQLTEGVDFDWPETVVREAYMRQQIRKYVLNGIDPSDIVVVCGSYHVDGLKSWEEEESLKGLPTCECMHTLMPYSYYRLSTRSGYGAGNKAPAYYELLWESLVRQEDSYAAYAYLSKIAGFMRDTGNPVSTASVIEAVRLAQSLAMLRGDRVMTLYDLKDAAITCLGEGNVPSLSLAFASVEIGTMIGSLPDGVSRTSIQEDFYRNLKALKLDKYKTVVLQDLSLDLRENRRVQSKDAAFLDLHRSFFLHQLRVLGIQFASLQRTNQETATYGENWTAKWTPEAEIEIVEAALQGDTVKLAASYVLSERIKGADSIKIIAKQLENAFLCGLPNVVLTAISALQALAVDAVSIEEMAACMEHLSMVISFGSIRQVETEPLIPIMEQLFYHFCLLLPDACSCDDEASKKMVISMEQVDQCTKLHAFLDDKEWISVISNIAKRDDLNTKISGYAASILLEKGAIQTKELNAEVSRRLSKGIPADLGAGWFEGLVMKNHYSLINRLSIWETLDGYLEELDDDEFKRALLFLRRAFADFTANEKDQIAENLGENWGLNGAEVSEIVNTVLGEEAQELVDSLADFDFDF